MNIDVYLLGFCIQAGFVQQAVIVVVHSPADCRRCSASVQAENRMLQRLCRLQPVNVRLLAGTEATEL